MSPESPRMIAFPAMRRSCLVGGRRASCGRSGKRAQEHVLAKRQDLEVEGLSNHMERDRAGGETVKKTHPLILQESVILKAPTRNSFE